MIARIVLAACVGMAVGCWASSAEVKTSGKMSGEELSALRRANEADGHLADYALLALLEFSSGTAAEKAQEAMNSGRLSLFEAMQKQAEAKGTARSSSARQGRNTRGSDDGSRPPEEDDSKRGSESAATGEYSADGLHAVDEIDPRVARVAFDVRQPTVSERSPNPLGPISTGDSTYTLVVVFNRYRRSFFSAEWSEVEAFAKREGLPFKQVLRDFDNADMMKYLSFQIWPQDEVAVKKLKIKAVQQDMKRVGAVQDPTTLPRAGNGKSRAAPREDVAQMLAERRAFFESLPPSVLRDHPEAYAMDIPDIIAAGWANRAAAGEPIPARAAYDDDTEGREEATQPDSDANPTTASDRPSEEL